jgi:hypothetical protein
MLNSSFSAYSGKQRTPYPEIGFSSVHSGIVEKKPEKLRRETCPKM